MMELFVNMLWWKGSERVEDAKVVERTERIRGLSLVSGSHSDKEVNFVTTRMRTYNE